MQINLLSNDNTINEFFNDVFNERFLNDAYLKY